MIFTSTTDDSLVGERLHRLLIPGDLADPLLCRTISRMERSFRSYAASYPLSPWAPHLVLDQEMRSLTEALFPVAEVARAFRLVLTRGCRFQPLWETTVLHTAASWLDVLQGVHPLLQEADPAPALALLAEDGDARRDFLFSLFLPRRYGPSFERYPLQARWLSSWLGKAGKKGRIRALDCACGSGEGTYRLAELIARCGRPPGACSVHGSTFEPVELFAAAHGYFPHDPRRQSAYRERISPLLQSGMEILFYLDDVATAGEGDYDVIVCNGLLGGPMLSGTEEVAAALARLAERLAPGGILLAADRFHAGWKKRLPDGALERLMADCRLEPLEVAEGVAARRKPGAATEVSPPAP